MKSKVIGFGCIARCGKDSAAKIISKYVDCSCFSFAHELKFQLRDLCLKNFLIDSFTEKESEKAIIRPLMVGMGETARNFNPNFWIDIIRKYIAQDPLWLQIITDVRYPNEADFIQKELKGILINLDRILPNGLPLSPANEHEKQYYPIMKARADYRIEASNLEQLEEQLVNVLDLKSK